MTYCTPNYAKAKSKALYVLQKYGFTDPPVNAKEIALEEGVKVFFIELSEKFSDISGFYDARHAEQAIYVNKNEPPVRQMFTIAHELGHKFLHEEWITTTDYKVLHRSQLIHQDEEKDPKEQEANCFAAHLLVPKFLLKRYKDIASIQELSKLFVVSRAVIQCRLNTEYGY